MRPARHALVRGSGKPVGPPQVGVFLQPEQGVAAAERGAATPCWTGGCVTGVCAIDGCVLTSGGATATVVGACVLVLGAAVRDGGVTGCRVVLGAGLAAGGWVVFLATRSLGAGRSGFAAGRSTVFGAGSAADGALVLSEFAGAADELRQAWLVNPYDINGMKAALLAAYQADEPEVTRRMKAMRKQVTQHDVTAWADSFMAALADTTGSSHDKSVRPARRS